MLQTGIFKGSLKGHTARQAVLCYIRTKVDYPSFVETYRNGPIILPVIDGDKGRVLCRKYLQ